MCETRTKLTVRAGTRSGYTTYDRSMESMRQARSTWPTPLRIAGFVLLCLASLLAGCSNDGAAPSTPPASTRQAEQQETAENERQGTNEAEAPAPVRREPKPSPTPRARACMRCSRRCAAWSVARGSRRRRQRRRVGCRRCETWLNGHPSSRNSKARTSESPWSKAVRMRVSSQSSCAPRKTLIASSDAGTPCCSSSRERGTCSTSWWVVYARPAKAGCSSRPAAARAGCPRTPPAANSCQPTAAPHSGATATRSTRSSTPSPTQPNQTQLTDPTGIPVKSAARQRRPTRIQRPIATINRPIRRRHTTPQPTPDYPHPPSPSHATATPPTSPSPHPATPTYQTATTPQTPHSSPNADADDQP